jgi:hypothetical protein
LHNNKYIEIFNPTSTSIDLSNYQLRMYANGSGTVSNTLTLSGTIAPYGVIVIANSSATIFSGTIDFTNAGVMGFNGDDALELVAKQAMQRKSGARGLRSILEKILLDTMYELPSIDNVTKVIIDTSVINGQSEPILIYDNQGKHMINVDPIDVHNSLDANAINVTNKTKRG